MEEIHSDSLMRTMIPRRKGFAFCYNLHYFYIYVFSINVSEVDNLVLQVPTPPPVSVYTVCHYTSRHLAEALRCWCQGDFPVPRWTP